MESESQSIVIVIVVSQKQGTVKTIQILHVQRNNEKYNLSPYYNVPVKKKKKVLEHCNIYRLIQSLLKSTFKYNKIKRLSTNKDISSSQAV